jgi:sugar O-acyltransferase (sialic acid O-acetyltransferase NeuD family)
MIIIAGASGFAKELLEIIVRDYAYDEVKFFDDITDDVKNYLYQKYEVIKDLNILTRYLVEHKSYVLGVGEPKSRSILYKKFNAVGGEIVTTVSSNSHIGTHGTIIGDGCNIMDGVSITNDVIVGKGSLFNLNCTIGHDVKIGEFCDISPGVNISGFVQLGHFCSVGTGSVIIPKITVGSNVVIGAGTVVTKSIPDNSLVVGVPGRVVKTLPPMNI